MPWTVIIRKNDIPRVQASVVEKTVEAVRDSAQFMRSYAQTIAPVDTGAFRGSLYINGPNNESDYAEAVARAQDLNPRAVIVPELKAADVDPKVDQLRDNFGRFSLPEAIVGSAVLHSLFLEEGTTRMGPRPTFRPAALVTENFFKDKMKKILDGW